MRTPSLLASVLLSTPALLLHAADAVGPAPLPLLDWEGRHLPAVPTAWRPLAESALTAARTWAGETRTWDPAAAARATSAFHVVAWAIPRAPGLPPEPAATGWWAADPAQAAATATLVATWPGQPAVVAGDRLTLTHPRIPEVGATTVEGMRLRLHGEALAACLKPLVDQQPPWATVLAAVAGWNLETTVDPAGTCRIATGIPLQALAPVDPVAVARLPSARWTVALGIAPRPADTDPTVLPGGTWSLSWDGGEHLVVALPDGPAVTTWLLRWGGQIPTMPGEEVDLAGHEGPWLRREADGWRLAFVRDDLALPARGASGPQFHGHLGWSGEPPATAGDSSALPWPLPGLEALLGTGPQAVTFTADAAGMAVLTTRDGALAGLLPALALRWFADEAADQHGMIRLRQVLARLKAAGIPVTREELVATQPVVPDAAGWLARAKTWDHAVEAPEATALKTALTGTRLPLVVATRDQLQAARAYGAEIAPLLALPAEKTASISWQGSAPTTSPAGLVLPYLNVQRQAAKSGLLLVQHGDATGLPLVDAARASLAKPGTLIEALVLNNVHALRDQAWLTATIQGLGDPGPWIAEPYRVEEDGRSAWAGERVMGGWFALAWLGTPEKTLFSWPVSTRWFGRHPLVPPWDRATLAGDLAEWLDDLANPGSPLPRLDTTRLHSRMVQDLLPAVKSVRTTLMLGRIHHHLARLAGTIVLHSRRGPLPEDAASLGLSLTVPGPTGPLPCTWQRLDDTSFRLALDVRGPAPAGMPGTRWRQWQEAARPELQEALAIRTSPPLIQIHQSAVAKAVAPAPVKIDF